MKSVLFNRLLGVPFAGWWRFKIDPGLMVVLLMATYAIWPLLTRPGLPTYNDSEIHVYRTIEFVSGWQSGVFYPRWAPDLYHGYGSPVFNYYAPLTYYLAGGYGWLLGGPVAGVKFVIVFAAYLGAVGMYVLARSLWGGAAGLVGAAVFSLSPYIVYVNPVARCDAPEALALAIVPWMLWAFTRALLAGGVFNQWLAALALAGLIFSHNLMAIIFFGWLLIWLLALWMEARRAGQTFWISVGRVLPSIVLGLGLTACLWLPAMAERNAVRLSDATTGYLDFRRTFIDPAVLLRPVNTVSEWAQMGLPQAIWAGLGVLSVLFVRERRILVGCLALVELLLLALTQAVMLPIWETVSFLAFLQFPWRLLAPVSIFTALLAGAAVHWSAGWRWPAAWPTRKVALFAGVTVVVCVIAIFPMLDPLPWADFENASVARLLKSGLDYWAGTTASNEFLPVTAQTPPPYQTALLLSYETGLVDKVNRSRLPPDAQAVVLEHTAVQDRFQMTSPVSFTLCLYTFYFPGWTGYVDDVEMVVTPSWPEGWVTMEVPAGEHDVRVRFEDTWPRQMGWGISLCALLGWVGWLAWRRKPRLAFTPARTGVSVRLALVLMGVLMVALGLRYIADPFSEWRVKPEKVEKPAAQYELRVPLEGNIALIAYDLPRVSAKPGGSFSVTLYWEAFAPVTRNLRVFVHLLNADGKLWGQSDHLRPGKYEDLPTSRWPVYRYVQDAHEAVIDPAAPPGEYTLKVGLWDGFTGERMHVLDADGTPTSEDGIVLTTTFRVEP